MSRLSTGASALLLSLAAMPSFASSIPWDGVFAAASTSRDYTGTNFSDSVDKRQFGSSAASATAVGKSGYASANVVLFDERYVTDVDAILHPRTVMELAGTAGPIVLNPEGGVLWQDGSVASVSFLEKIRLLVPEPVAKPFDERIHITGSGSVPNAGGYLFAMETDDKTNGSFGGDLKLLTGTSVSFDTHQFSNLAIPAGVTDVDLALTLYLGASDGGFFNYADTLELDFEVDPSIQVLGTASGLFPIYHYGSDIPEIPPQLADLAATGGFGPPSGPSPPTSPVPEPAAFVLIATGLLGLNTRLRALSRAADEPSRG